MKHDRSQWRTCGLLSFAIHNRLARIAIFTPPILWCIYTQNLPRQENIMKGTQACIPTTDPPSVCI